MPCEQIDRLTGILFAGAAMAAAPVLVHTAAARNGKRVLAAEAVAAHSCRCRREAAWIVGAARRRTPLWSTRASPSSSRTVTALFFSLLGSVILYRACMLLGIILSLHTIQARPIEIGMLYAEHSRYRPQKGGWGMEESRLDPDPTCTLSGQPALKRGGRCPRARR